MKDQKIIVEPFTYTNIIECTIHKKVNEHFLAYISGYIDENNEDEFIMKIKHDQGIRIKVIDEDGNRKCLFTGIINSASVLVENKLKKLIIRASSRTSLLDIKERTRIFQDSNNTYKDISEYISDQNPGSVFVYSEGRHEKINKMVVQYEETDWTFLKRMASHLNTVLVSDSYNDNICLCFGIPETSKKVTINSSYYTITKCVEDYMQKKMNNVSVLTEQDETSYCIESRDIYELCSTVLFARQKLFIYEITTKMVGSELIHKYILKRADGFKTIKINNLKIIGASILGNIIDVKHDLVKIKSRFDANCLKNEKRWFNYSTVYASEDGAGWYCMPENGDLIRLYFPDSEEYNAYVISAVHIGMVDRKRKNPEEKSFRTIYDKEIRFTPSKILITNNNGLSIILDDKTGIRISSKKEIDLAALENIEICSGDSIKMQAEQGVLLQQQNNLILIKNGIYEYGNNILHG